MPRQTVGALQLVMNGSSTENNSQLVLDPLRNRLSEGTRHEAPAEAAEDAKITCEVAGFSGEDSGCNAAVDPPQILSPFAAFEPFNDSADESLDTQPSEEDKATPLNAEITRSSNSQIKRSSSGPLQHSIADASDRAEVPAQKCAISNAGLLGATPLRAASMPYTQNIRNVSKVTFQTLPPQLRDFSYRALSQHVFCASNGT